MNISSKIKFVFLLFIGVIFSSFSQERGIRIFEKKQEASAKLYQNNSLHLVVFHCYNQTFYFQIDQNNSWKCETVSLEEWQELPENTLVLLQPQEEYCSEKGYKKKVEPVFLGSLSFPLLHLPAKDPVVYSLSWSMNSFKQADNSVQTSKKMVSNNCCKNGMCSILISRNKKNNSISLLASN